MGANTSSKPVRKRIEALDLARGIALVAMVAYHFTWDLEFFGYLARGTANSGGWRLFARAIASSFLFMVGLSLVLAHLRGIRWRPFWIRLAQVSAGALAITIVTYFATPQSFVFFGILHQIVVASLIGLIFLRCPPVLTLVAGVIMILLPNLFVTDAMNGRALAWIGFAAREPVSNDIVPIFPWTGIVLLGMAASQWLAATSGWLRIKALNPSILGLRLFDPLRWIGRHSLAFYLIHQPVNIALIAGFAQIMPPDTAVVFRQECTAACSAQGRDGASCARYCDCARTELTGAGLFEPYMSGRLTADEEDGFRSVLALCTARHIP